MTAEKEDSGWKAALKQVLSSQILASAKEAIKSTVKKGQEILYQTEKKIEEALIAAIILLVGVIFVAIAIALMISDYFNVGTQWGLLIVGLVLIVIALLLKWVFDRKKYYRLEQ